MSYQLASRDSEAFVVRMESDEPDAFASVIGESDAITYAIRVGRRVARGGGANVLLVGETGTGKEVFARAIHYEGPRRDEPFVAVNCAAIPAQLIESELFGHERGAFTDAKKKKLGLLELAEGGTLFLDEVSSLPMDLQPKLLRALEERRVRRVGGFEEVEIRCRVTAATNVPLEDLVDEGSFREDLFYRLNVLRVPIPPLRDRGDDVVIIAEHVLGELSAAHGLPTVSLTPAAKSALSAHRWPGNVRELKNALERALLMSEGVEIDIVHLALGRRSAPADPTTVSAGGAIMVPTSGRSLRSVEEELVRMTLEITSWNKTAAARVLGISRPTLHRKIDEYGILSAVN